MGSFFLGTKCVQVVSRIVRNSVDTLPHYPHFPIQTNLTAEAMCTNTTSFAAVVRAAYTEKYTDKFVKSTLLYRALSPVSTAPIITTTTYIRRKRRRITQ